METPSDPKAKLRFVTGIVELLVLGRYHDLEQLSSGVRLTAEEIAQAVTDYGRTLVMPPSDVGLAPDFRLIIGSHPPAWSVWVPLFTREEGRSDLTLELTLLQDPAGGYTVEIDNLRVP